MQGWVILELLNGHTYGYLVVCMLLMEALVWMLLILAHLDQVIRMPIGVLLGLPPIMGNPNVLRLRWLIRRSTCSTSRSHSHRKSKRALMPCLLGVNGNPLLNNICIDLHLFVL